MIIRRILGILAIACITMPAAADSQLALREEWKLPKGTFSIGLIGNAVFPIVTSDVVGPDAPEGSHQRTTSTVGVQGGVEVAWEFHRSLDLILSVRGRGLTMLAFDGEATVHQHVDLVQLQGVTYEVTTDHGVRHTVRRLDVQGLVGVEFAKVPVRLIGGLGVMVTGADRIEETFHEVSRRTVPTIDVVSDHDDAAASFRVTDRVGMVLGVELPFRFKRVEVAVHVTADVGLSTTVETGIPASSHIMATGISVAWRF
jgi:hypothetical protein